MADREFSQIREGMNTMTAALKEEIRQLKALTAETLAGKEQLVALTEETRAQTRAIWRVLDRLDGLEGAG